MPEPPRLVVRVTETEKAIIERHAATAGVSVSRYIRHRAINPERIGLMTVDDFEVLVDVLAQLHGIANNLNQFMHAVNRRASSLPDENSLKEAAVLIECTQALVLQITEMLKTT